ncbi:MAG TPA: hypothetical protein VFT08_01365 [Pyrinomonadaceae bacterium]|nr:hypothetical protein [Pyrinomonadaceae bacterium]
MLENPPLPSNIDNAPVEIYEEGRRYFMGKGRLNKTLARFASELEEHGIDYGVIGATALLAHGYPRFTEDIHVLMTREGLEKFHAELIGLGYAPAFPGAKKKLRSTRDVQELIKFKNLDADFADKLDPYVRAKYIELQEAVSKSQEK